MDNYKQINGTLIINGNQEGFRLEFLIETADKLCSLYREALATVLRDIEEEEQYRVFDKWFKETEPELYNTAMAEFMSELDLRLRGGIFDGDEEFCRELFGVEPPCGINDGFYWPESRNDIAIESFSE